MRAGSAIAVGVVATTLLVWWLILRTGDMGRASGPEIVGQQDSLTLRADQKVDVPTARGEQPEGVVAEVPKEAGEPTARRELVGAQEIRWRVALAGEGGQQPAVGAVGSWTPLDNDVEGFFPTREETLGLYLLSDRDSRLAQGTRWAEADGEGRLMFAGLPPAFPVRGAAVWITHTEAAPRIAVVSEGTSAPGTFVLDPAPAASLRVVDGAGQPVAGALVRRRGLPPEGWRPDGASQEERARRALYRETATDEQGWAQVPPFAGPQLVVVEHGSARAQLWLDGDPQELEVRLVPTFRLSGRVRPGAGLGPWAMVNVFGRLADGGGEVRLGAATFDEGRSFGPLELPRAPGLDELVLRLQHAFVQPEELVVAAPSVDEHLRVEFQGDQGHSIWFLVRDAETQEPIPYARVSTSWGEGQRRIDTRGGASGHVELTGLPLDYVAFRVEAEGYSTLDEMLFMEERLVGRLVPLDLFRPGSLSILVLEDDQPAERFMVFYGQDSVWPLSERSEVRDGAGRLELEGLPQGRYALHAYFPSREISGIERVEVRPGRNSEVVLRHRPGARLTVQVLDGRTMRPLPEAEGIVHLVTADRLPILTLADGFFSDQEGKLFVEPFPVTDGELLIRAPGFLAMNMRVPHAESGQSIDLGAAILEPESRITVQLKGAAHDPRDYTLQASGFPESSFPFDVSGRAEMFGVPLGFPLELVHPDGTNDYVLQSRLDREVTLYAAPGELTVAFEGPGGAAARPLGLLSLHCSDPEGRRVTRHVRVGTASELRLPGLPARGASAFLTDGDGVPHAPLRLELDELGGGRFVYRLRPASLEFLVLDVHGAPVEAAWVGVYDRVAQGTLSYMSRLTDSEGRVRIGRSDSSEVSVTVQAPGGRWTVDRRISLPPEGEVVELRLGPLAPFSVRVLGQDGPLAGVHVVARPTTTPERSWSGRTETGGLFQFPPIDADALWFELHLAGHFPHRRLVRRGEAVGELLARPLAALTLELRDGEGAPLPGISVELQHEQLAALSEDPAKETVGRWAAAGQVPQVPLASDGLGRLHFSALPVGRYRWVADGPSGRATGSFEHDPSRTGALLLVLP